MKLHAKNGNLGFGDHIFLPAIGNSEFEIDSDDFDVEVVNAERGIFTEYLKPGKYKKVTGLVKVTRYFSV